MATTPLAHVAELWRYPVKSMGGERVDSLPVIADGIAHDRRYAFLSSGAPAGKPRLTSRERAALLQYSASVGTGLTEVRTPDGRIFAIADPALSAHLKQHLPQGHSITLEHAAEAPPYTDVRPIALVSTQTLARLSQTFGEEVDPRRFRANVVLAFQDEMRKAMTQPPPQAFPEDALAGQAIRIGQTCCLRLLERIPRCRVVTLDPDTAEPEPALMKHLDRNYNGRLGIYAAVVTPGTIAVGDPVFTSQTHRTATPVRASRV